jgi:hypothetical protein
MLTEYQKGSIFGAVMLIVAFAAAFSTIPNQQFSEQRATQTAANNHPEEALWDTFSRDPIAILTCALVFVGGAQVWLFYRQLKFIREGLVDAKEASDAAKLSAQVADESLKLSRETAQRQLRAYVFVKDGSVIRKTNDNGQISISAQFCIRNFGLTPAYKFRTTYDVMVLETGSEDFPDIHNDSERLSTISPNGEINGSHDIVTSDLDRCEIDKGLKSVFIFGRFDYVDAFGDKRYLKFYFVTFKQIEPNRWTIQPCRADEGN